MIGVGEADIEPQHQFRDQSTEFHQSNVLADASARTAAELYDTRNGRFGRIGRVKASHRIRQRVG